MSQEQQDFISPNEKGGEPPEGGTTNGERAPYTRKTHRQRLGEFYRELRAALDGKEVEEFKGGELKSSEKPARMPYSDE